MGTDLGPFEFCPVQKLPPKFKKSTVSILDFVHVHLENGDRWSSGIVGSVGFRIYPCEPRKRAPACFGFIEDYLTWLCGDSDKMEVPHLDFPRHASPSWKKRRCDVIEVWRQQTYQACQSKIEQQIQKRKVDWVLWMKAMKFPKSFLYLPKWWITNVWHEELLIILILTLYPFSWANHSFLADVSRIVNLFWQVKIEGRGTFPYSS